MKGDPVDLLDDSNIWFECKDHPGTNEFRRVIRFVAEDFHGIDYSRAIYKAIRKELRGRKFVTGETQEDLREVPSRGIIATIGTAFEAEQERRERRRKKRKRERQKYCREAKEEDASSQHSSEKKERKSKHKKHHKEKKNKVEAEFDGDDIEQHSRRKGSSTAATEDTSLNYDKLQTSSRDILDGDCERDDLQDTDNGRWRFRVSDVVWFLVIVALAVTAWIVGTQVLKNKEQRSPTSIDWTAFVDPREGNASQVRWPSQGGQGIALEVLNAADESWEKWIQLTVSDWDHGDPNIDPLSLTITRVERDINCTQVEGKIKLCNGDYGETQWRGLNDVAYIVHTNQIVSSAARLNEWYLQKESDDQKLYTVCHELGHAFGLPHWDEDFENQDMGNCMDYSMNPQFNNRPDTPNFYFLAQLYGDANGSGIPQNEKPNIFYSGAQNLRQLESPKLSGHFRNDLRKLKQQRVLYSDQHFEVHAGMLDEERGMLRYYYLA